MSMISWLGWLFGGTVWLMAVAAAQLHGKLIQMQPVYTMCGSVVSCALLLSCDYLRCPYYIEYIILNGQQYSYSGGGGVTTS